MTEPAAQPAGSIGLAGLITVILPYFDRTFFIATGLVKVAASREEFRPVDFLQKQDGRELTSPTNEELTAMLGATFTIERDDLHRLMGDLARAGYRVVGATVRDSDRGGGPSRRLDRFAA